MRVMPRINTVSGSDIRTRGTKSKLDAQTLEIKTSVDGLGQYLGNRIEGLQEYIETSEKKDKAVRAKRGPYKKREEKQKKEDSENLEVIADKASDQLKLSEEALKVQKEQLEEQKEQEYRDERARKKSKFSLRGSVEKVKTTGGKIINGVKASIPNDAGGIVKGIIKLIAAGYLLKKFWPLIQKKFIPFMKDTVLPWLENTVLPWMQKNWKEILGGLAIMSFIKSPLKFMMAPFKLALGAGGFILKSVKGMLGTALSGVFGPKGVIGKGIGVLAGGIKTATLAVGGLIKSINPFAKVPVAGAPIPGANGGLAGGAAGKKPGVAGKIGGGLKSVGKMGFKGLMTAMKGIARVIPFLGLAVMAFDLIDAFFPKFWDNIAEIFSWENIKAAGNKIWDFVSDGFNSVGAWISEKFGVDNMAEVGIIIWDKVKLGLTKIGDWIADKFKDIGAFFEAQIRALSFGGIGDKIADIMFGKSKASLAREKQKNAENRDKRRTKRVQTEFENRGIIKTNLTSKDEIKDWPKISKQRTGILKGFIESDNFSEKDNAKIQAIIDSRNEKFEKQIKALDNKQTVAIKKEKDVTKAMVGPAANQTAKTAQTKPNKKALASKAVPKSSPSKPTPNTAVANTVTAKPKKGPSGKVAKGDEPLLHRISIGEGTVRDGYDTTIGHGKWDPTNRPITSMTLGEIEQFQGGLLANGAISSAVGKYQFIRKTLREVKGQMGLGDNVLFDANTQDAMITHRLKKMRKMDKWKSGNLTDDKFQLGLAQEFASIASPYTGVSYYGQHTGTSTAEIRPAMAAAKGGKTTMPDSFNEGTPQGITASAWRNDGTAGMVGGSSQSGAEGKDETSFTKILDTIDRETFGFAKSALSSLGIVGEDGGIVKGKYENSRNAGAFDGLKNLFSSTKDEISKAANTTKKIANNSNKGTTLGSTSNDSSSLSGIIDSIDRETFGFAKGALGMMGATDSTGGLSYSQGKAEVRNKANTGNSIKNLEITTARKKQVEIDGTAKKLAQQTAVKEHTPKEANVTNHNTIVPPAQSDKREKVTIENSDFIDFTLSQIGIYL